MENRLNIKMVLWHVEPFWEHNESNNKGLITHQLFYILQLKDCYKINTGALYDMKTYDRFKFGVYWEKMIDFWVLLSFVVMCYYLFS